MSLSKDDPDLDQAVHGGYDGATDVSDDDGSEQGKRRRPIGFRPPKKRT